jgi:lipopolysaccharide/colanic/teichoic acid biosynthesis glycosyltransferase
MSLVGPRPSLPYETAVYHAWHKRRLIEAKPGITGLWQVCGRSRTTFVQMVRMDLQYSATRTSLMDLQILLMTPKAVFIGDGAC